MPPPRPDAVALPAEQFFAELLARNAEERARARKLEKRERRFVPDGYVL